MPLQTHRRALTLALPMLILTHSASAAEFCATELPLAPGVAPSIADSFKPFPRIVAADDRADPMIDLGANSILTIRDGTLVPHDAPPLDLWNRILPTLVRWPDGEIWAYTSVKDRLYRLNRESSAFEPLKMEGLGDIAAFSASGTARRHDDRRVDRDHDGRPPLFGYRGPGLDRLVEITRTGIAPFAVPGEWPPGGWSPIVAPGLGSFLPGENDIWFRPDGSADWAPIAAVRNLRSLYAQSPFEMFAVETAPDRTIRVLLDDRVLVGEIDDSSGIPRLDYQLAGHIIIHQPDRQVLVFPNEPITRTGNEQPPFFQGAQGLYATTPAAPRIVPGDGIQQPVSGQRPFNSSIFHAPSGLTLISHSGGIAGFDGKTVHDIPALRPPEGSSFVLRSAGGRHLVDLMGGGEMEITDDLTLRRVNFPETPGLLSISYSDVLQGFIVTDARWKRAYASADLETFTQIEGISQPVMGVAGDLPREKGVLVNSPKSAWIVRSCP